MSEYLPFALLLLISEHFIWGIPVGGLRREEGREKSSEASVSAVSPPKAGALVAAAFPQLTLSCPVCKIGWTQEHLGAAGSEPDYTFLSLGWYCPYWARAGTWLTLQPCGNGETSSPPGFWTS